MQKINERVIIEDGVEAWNKMTIDLKKARSYPDLSDINLSRRIFEGYKFNECDFRNADLSESTFVDCQFNEAIFKNANLKGSFFSGCMMLGANFENADCTKAFFPGSSLQGSNLTNANFTNALLWGAILINSVLTNTNFTKTRVDGCVLGYLNFKNSKYISSILHEGPSVIDFETIRESSPLPLEFLRGVGLSEDYIENLALLTGKAISTISCFISYSHQDNVFAKKLYSALHNSGIKCWYAPEDLKGGQKLHTQIFEAIKKQDKLLLILSNNSIKSDWVRTEIFRARKREKEENRQILFPILISNYKIIQDWELFDGDHGIDLAKELREFYLPDFSKWKDKSDFQKKLNALLNDLRK